MHRLWIAACIITAFAQESQTPQRFNSAEVAKLARSAMVRVGILDHNGFVVDYGLGFHIGGGRIATAFELTQAVSRLRVEWESGKKEEVTSVVALNSLQDWAFLQSAALDAPALTLKRDPLEAGRKYLVMSEVAGSWMPLTVTLGERRGPAWEFSERFSANSVGAPIFNNHGEVVAMVGGSPIRGLRSVLRAAPGSALMLPLSYSVLARPMAFSRDTAKDAQPVPLIDLMRAGVTLMPISDDGAHLGSTLKGLVKRRTRDHPSDPAPLSGFGPEIENIYLCTIWSAEKDRKLDMRVALFTSSGEAVSPAYQGELVLDHGRKRLATEVAIPIFTLKSGVYRAELQIDGLPAWRSFFRKVE